MKIASNSVDPFAGDWQHGFEYGEWLRVPNGRIAARRHLPFGGYMAADKDITALIKAAVKSNGVGFWTIETEGE